MNNITKQINVQQNKILYNFWLWLEERPKLRLFTFIMLSLKGIKFLKKLIQLIYQIYKNNRNINQIIRSIQKQYNPQKKYWAIITGGSMGIGQQVGVLLAKANFNILVISNSQQGNLETEKILKNKNPNIEVETILVDLLSKNNFSELFVTQQIMSSYSSFDNNNNNNSNIQKQQQQIYDNNNQQENLSQNSSVNNSIIMDNSIQQNPEYDENCFNFIQILKKKLQYFLKEKKVSILVNCAGIVKATGEFGNIENPSEIYDVLQVNSIANIQMCKLVLDYFHKDKKIPKAIINIGSLESQLYQSKNHVYGFSKSIIEGFAQALPIEYENYNIRVLTMLPYMVMTRLSGFRNNSFFSISAQQMAEQILRDLYYEQNISIGNIKHQLLYSIYGILNSIMPQKMYHKKQQDFQITQKAQRKYNNNNSNQQN